MSKGAGHVTVAHVAALASQDDQTAAFASVIEAQAGEGDKPVRLRLLPMGDFKPRDARINAFSIKGDAHANQIIAASQAYAGAQDIPIDYDHQSVYSAVKGVGGQAPAAGWIDPASLSVETGAEGRGIYGTVSWTPKARDAVRAREYRYLSPVINHEPSGRVTRLINVGLTNSPAVDGLTKLAASIQPHNQEPAMNLSALAASLGLAADATLAQIEAATTAKLAALATSEANLAALRSAAGVAADADQTAALSTISTLKSSGSDGATTALLATLQSDVVRLSAERNERLVDDAIKAGKVTPAQKQHYIDLMRTNEATALSLIGSATAIVTPGQQTTGQPGGEITTLSAEQKAAARAIGVSEDAYLATLKSEVEGGAQ